jgi:hypothetical protein
MKSPEIPAELLHGVVEGLNLQNPVLCQEFLRVQLENLILFDRKQSDYGSGNIAKYGSAGCDMRASDKVERLATLFRKGRRRRVVDESIEDTRRDLSNYPIIAIMCDKGKWPGVEGVKVTEPKSTPKTWNPALASKAAVGKPT